MKKRVLLTVLTLICATFCAHWLTACGLLAALGSSNFGNPGYTHEHVYDQQFHEVQYLKSEATCTQKAVYYYACSCGEHGTETYEYGDYKHTYDRQVAEQMYLMKKATCTTPAKYFYSCKCGARGIENYFEYGDVDPDAHTFDKKVREDKYLASAPSFTDRAVYYYSCECGACGDTTFEGTVLQPTEEVSYQISQDGRYYTVTGKKSTKSSDIVIAEKIDNKPVKSIGYRAFAGRNELTSVVIPDSVTTIDDYAFENCPGLKSVTLGAGLKTIGGHAFENCTALESITLPDSLTDIGKSAFTNCRGITIDTIPDKVTSIGESAFEGCSSITSIEIPDSVTSIGSKAFTGCPIEEATIPAIACTLIRNSKLKSVKITSGTRIPYYAFKGCTELTSASICLPESDMIIEDYAFYDCVALENVTIFGVPSKWDDVAKGNNWLPDNGCKIDFI